jgi:high-affinity Fe2+/Pb2+ permease
MNNLLFWLGIGAAQRGAGSKPNKRPRWVVSLVFGVLVAVLIGVGVFLLLVSQKL